jgi:hypothetical protein
MKLISGKENTQMINSYNYNLYGNGEKIHDLECGEFSSNNLKCFTKLEFVLR